MSGGHNVVCIVLLWFKSVRIDEELSSSPVCRDYVVHVLIVWCRCVP